MILYRNTVQSGYLLFKLIIYSILDPKSTVCSVLRNFSEKQVVSLGCQQHHFIARCPMHVKARNILTISDLQPLSTMVPEVLPLTLVESKALHIIQYSFQENVLIRKCLFVIKNNHLLCLSSKIVGKIYP